MDALVLFVIAVVTATSPGRLGGVDAKPSLKFLDCAPC